MRCIYCGRDIDELYQDNMGSELNKPICEDCFDRKYPCNKPPQKRYYFKNPYTKKYNSKGKYPYGKH